MMFIKLSFGWIIGVDSLLISRFDLFLFDLHFESINFLGLAIGTLCGEAKFGGFDL